LSSTIPPSTTRGAVNEIDELLAAEPAAFLIDTTTEPE
jgi:hypothetical protein